jgi:multidrug resistance efflux pump
MEFEGEVVFLSNPQDKLKSALQETQGLLEAARERISRLLGEHSSAPRIAKAAKKKAKIARRVARYKKPGDPKRVFSPEKLAVLRENMATARAARSAKAASG